MIIDFSRTIDSYDEIIGIYGDLGYICPKCKENRLIRYASYNRSVLSFEGDSLECRMVGILRLRCKNCGSTHAVLTADMVPFWAYSLPCILVVLQAAFRKNGSVTEAGRKTGISYQVISDITVPIRRRLSSTNEKRVVEELNVHKRVQDLSMRILELKKQKRGVDKAIEKLEKDVEQIFDQMKTDCMEIESGLLVRRRKGDGYEWLIEL